MNYWLEQEKNDPAFWQGARQGLRLYAWWKDGVEYIGTRGTTLRQALKDVEDAERELALSGTAKKIPKDSQAEIQKAFCTLRSAFQRHWLFRFVISIVEWLAKRLPKGGD